MNTHQALVNLAFTIYLMCNSFMVGRLWEDIKSSSDKSYERIARVITIMFLGLIFTAIYYIIVALKWLNKTLEIDFFLKFYFGDNTVILTEEFVWNAKELRKRSNWLHKFVITLSIFLIERKMKKKSPVFNPDISDLTEKVEIFSLTTEEKTTEKPLEEKHDEKEGSTKP